MDTLKKSLFILAASSIAMPTLFLYGIAEMLYVDCWIGREKYDAASYAKLRELFRNEKFDEYMEKVNRVTPTMIQLEECSRRN